MITTYIVSYTFDGKRKSITVHSPKTLGILLDTMRGDYRYNDVALTTNRVKFNEIVIQIER